MARYTGPAYKKSRRLGFSTLENGKDLAKRAYAPGQHGQDRRRKLSEYGIQMQEKQKVRILYGLNEKQFHKVFLKASKMHGIAGENLLILLESRLDNMVYRLGMARTRRSARQIVNHGHILVNGKKVDIPSYRVKPGDVVGIRENSKDHKGIEIALANVKSRVDYINYDEKKKQATYVRYPQRSELNADINESLIVEYYSRV